MAKRKGKKRGRPSSSSQLALPPICGEVKEEEIEQEEEAAPVMDAKVMVSTLHCRACLRPLKPPAYRCAGGHLACGPCGGGGDNLCLTCDPPTAYAQCVVTDSFLNSVLVPCPHACYGCKAQLAYHEAGDHGLACAWAPCPCPEPGCGFLGSPPQLHGHLASQHAWPVTRVTYGSPVLVSGMRVASEPERRHLLVAGKGDDETVFLLVVIGGFLAKVVHVRAAAGAAQGRWWYKCTMWAHAAEDEVTGFLDLLLMEAKVRSCAVASEEAAREAGGRFLSVPQPDDDMPPHEEVVLLRVRIDKFPLPA